MTDSKTATELRRILDVLGIEHSDFESAFRHSTRWKDSNGRVIEHQVSKDADFGDTGIVRNLMPEQAIAATLGKFRLTAEQVSAIFEKHWNNNWQTIADELNAALGAGECEQEEGGWSTEGDHARVWLTCGHDCMVETVQDLPNFCPTCGKAVKR